MSGAHDFLVSVCSSDLCTSDLVSHRLFVCLDKQVQDRTIASLVLGDEDIFICLDSALSDEAKVQLEDGSAVVTKFYRPGRWSAAPN